jgi:hypothetical protein
MADSLHYDFILSFKSKILKISSFMHKKYFLQNKTKFKFQEKFDKFKIDFS